MGLEQCQRGMVRNLLKSRTLAVMALITVAVSSLVYTLNVPHYRSTYWKKGAVMPAGVDSKNLFLMKLDGKWGFVDREGRITIPPRFDDGREFSEGLAAFELNEKWGYIDALGEVVIEPEFDDAYSFSDGLAAIVLNGRYGYIRRNGELAIEPRYGFAHEFSEGFALVSTGPTRIGPFAIGRRSTFFVDQDGERLGNLELEDGRSFSDGVASVSLNGTSGCIDRTGRLVIEPRFSWIEGFSEGLAAAEIRDESGEHWGFIDKTGALVIPARFDGAGEFSEGLALVVVNGRHGFVDRNGTVVIEPRFRIARRFSEGRAAFMDESGCYGFIDREGHVVVAAQFYPLVEDYTNGLALVDVAPRESFGSDPKYGYIDLDGTYVWPPSK